MPVGYRMEIDAPKTTRAGARTWVFAPSGGDYPGRLISAEVALKKEKRAVSHCQAVVQDPVGPKGWEIFNALPDPAFADVPVRFYLTKPGDGAEQLRMVFDGVLTRMTPMYPGPSALTLIAHDRSVDMRKASTKVLKQFRNKTSVQIATEVIESYGYNVSKDLGDIVPRVRRSHIAVAPSGRSTFSDWDVAASALDADGLEMFMFGETVTIRERATAAYPTKFARGDHRIIRFSPDIQHVATPGKRGNKKTRLAYENAGTINALLGVAPLTAATNVAAEAALQAASAITHRDPVGGLTKGEEGAVSEKGGNPWQGNAQAARRRKDRATLEIHSVADLGLQHIITIEGFGAKADGQWEPEQITHRLFGPNPAITSVEMHRGLSKGAANSAGLVFEKSGLTL